ncbi:hypothetical protein GCK32_001187 [Trichostrongylus colubriformis]|uniref:Uncharacterized protein n=1 Tax=Trichostrongylus colubriformis TaxID=6319 RepID=A0AAN8IMC1_TRICO
MSRLLEKKRFSVDANAVLVIFDNSQFLFSDIATFTPPTGIPKKSVLGYPIASHRSSRYGIIVLHIHILFRGIYLRNLTHCSAYRSRTYCCRDLSRILSLVRPIGSPICSCRELSRSSEVVCKLYSVGFFGGVIFIVIATIGSRFALSGN